jgi:hypothetical protein
MSLVRARWLVLGAAATLAVAAPVLIVSGEEAKPLRAAAALPPVEVDPRPSVPLAFALTAPPFDPDRTAETAPAPEAAAEAAAAPPPPPPAPPPALVGIATGGRGRAVALLKSASGETVMIGRGATVDGWRLVAIGRDTVTLARDGASQTLRFAFPNRSGGSPPPPPPIPQPEPVRPDSAPPPSSANTKE